MTLILQEKDLLIKELSEKNTELIKKNYVIAKKNLDLIEEINELTNSKWFRFYYFLRNPLLLIEKSFFKIFPHWLIPQPIKEKIKQLINLEKTKEKDFYFRTNKILEIKKPYKGDIIIYSVIAWGYRFQRPQQLAIQFQKQGYRIWYIKNEFIISSVLTPNKYPKVYNISEDVYEVTLPSRSPLFIYTDELNQRNSSLMRSSLETLVSTIKMKNIIQVVDHPFWVNLATKLPYPMIYDCMDDHQSFDLGDKKEDNETKIAEQSDNIVVTSNFLKEKMSKYKEKVVSIKNACDYNHFSKQINVPNNFVARLKHPIIGYYGAIAEWFDFKIVAEVVKKNPSWNFLFIGAVSDNSVLNLKSFPQVHFVGEKSYSSLPSFLSVIDVCIIPFKLTSLIKATDPVKFYEMLAAGKPVVSVKIPEISHFREPILYTVDQTHSFDYQIKKALSQNSADFREERKKIAKMNTWEIRGKEFMKIIEKIYPKVSVIIVSYNNWYLTRNCLESLEKDGYPNKEIIVIDNMSSDETRDELIKLEKQGKIKVILNKKNFGFAKANNIGLRMAKGKYISLLNNDVEVTPYWIQKMIRHLKNDETIGLIGPVTNESGNETRIPIRGPKPRIINVGKKYSNDRFDKLFEIQVIPAQCWFLRKKDMNKVGLIDERFGIGMFEDDDYCLRIKKIGKKIICAEDIFIYHKGKASFNKLDDEEYSRIFKENKRKFEKKWRVKWVPHKHRKIKSL